MASPQKSIPPRRDLRYVGEESAPLKPFVTKKPVKKSWDDPEVTDAPMVPLPAKAKVIVNGCWKAWQF